ncbi:MULTISPECIES: cell division ATP-binding protein FtsE [Brevundimonas]|jgi:cell division transport system ATP-binding protein|uniref:cell division ATP-binding protein FtsE n=1 Tax=Brevundimonas sp. 357 TaxID=2555782 RepID=UPI000F790013|nr:MULTISPECIES: ATP-binding cassette domain-containing protein [Brevundimonas]RSB47930.1 ATP-binding cassette domain-containing protein [Brevundimonas sp. 357]
MPDSNRRAADPDSTPDTVRLKGVGFGYTDRPAVLRDVNLTLPNGSFHFLTGPSGAGKSSLLRLLTLAARPQAGRISLFGREVTHLPRRDVPAFRRRMGVIFQDFRLLDHLSAFDNAALPLRLAGEGTGDYAEDVREMLRWVGLGQRLDALPPTLSGGEKQRLAIARAVVTRPRLILADEPTGSVDAAMAEKLMRLFQSLHRLGATVLIASHDEVLAERSGASVLRLEGGRLGLIREAASETAS